MKFGYRDYPLVQFAWKGLLCIHLPGDSQRNPDGPFQRLSPVLKFRVVLDRNLGEESIECIHRLLPGHLETPAVSATALPYCVPLTLSRRSCRVYSYIRMSPASPPNRSRLESQRAIIRV